MGSKRFERVVRTLSRRQVDLTIAMENVHKTRNLGAVARTCDGAGIGQIHAISTDPTAVKLDHKAACGTEKWITVRQHLTIAAAYSVFRNLGLRILAATVEHGTVDFRSIDYTLPSIIVVGSELDGLSAEALENADVLLHVPLMGMVESLNVSVASGIILYEAVRQREQAGFYASPQIGQLEFDRLLFEWLHPRVARYCQTTGRPYPRLDEGGEIQESISGNLREGFK